MYVKDGKIHSLCIADIRQFVFVPGGTQLMWGETRGHQQDSRGLLLGSLR